MYTLRPFRVFIAYHDVCIPIYKLNKFLETPEATLQAPVEEIARVTVTLINQIPFDNV